MDQLQLESSAAISYNLYEQTKNELDKTREKIS